MRTGAILALALLAGCATAKLTPEQEFARAAWDICPKADNVVLDSIEPNGKIHYRSVGSVSGSRELDECLREYYEKNPMPTPAPKPAR